MSIRSMSFLRRVLLIDAAASAAMGLALILLAGALADLFQLPAALLSEAGVVLLPFAAFVGYLAMSSNPSRAGVWAVIALNVIWAVDSIVLLFTGWIAPNALGVAFIVGQSMIVALFGELEYIGLRKAATVVA